jgi:hypothetical protein
VTWLHKDVQIVMTIAYIKAIKKVLGKFMFALPTTRQQANR